jgi:hypothetical protein
VSRFTARFQAGLAANTTASKKAGMLKYETGLAAQEPELFDLFMNSDVCDALMKHAEPFILYGLGRKNLEPLVRVSLRHERTHQHFELLLEETRVDGEPALVSCVNALHRGLDGIRAAFEDLRRALATLVLERDVARDRAGGEAINALMTTLEPALEALQAQHAAALARVPSARDWSDVLFRPRLIDGRWVPLPCGGGIEFDRHGQPQRAKLAVGDGSWGDLRDVERDVEALFGWRIELAWDPWDKEDVPDREAEVVSLERTRPDN